MAGDIWLSPKKEALTLLFFFSLVKGRSSGPPAIIGLLNPINLDQHNLWSGMMGDGVQLILEVHRLATSGLGIQRMWCDIIALQLSFSPQKNL